MTRKHHSSQRTQEDRTLKASKNKHDIHGDSGKCAVQRPILVLRKTGNPERPPTPIETGRFEYQLGPVFVPNKLMGRTQSCSGVTRTCSSTQRPSQIARINASLTGVVKRESNADACRASRAEISSHLPTSERTSLARLPKEELKHFQKLPFLPKIERPSKTSLSLGLGNTSLHSVSSAQHVLKRSPTSSEMLRLPPAKSRPGNMVCKRITSAEKTPPSSDSSNSSPKERLVPKPPSLPKTRSSRSHLRRSRKKPT